MPLSSKRVRFDGFEFDLNSGELRKNGIKLKLHGQPVQVLSALLEHPGEIVTRDELRQRLWAADTFVDFEQNLNSAVKRLREALGDSADKPRYIETLPRHGYRFVGVIKEAEHGLLRPQSPPTRARTKVLGSVLAVAIFVSAAVTWIVRQRLFVPHPQMPHSLAVLSLENLSGKEDQEYFAEGITEELITELGKFRDIRVISHQSVLQYKGTSKPLPKIASELKVDALVQGATMREGNRVRVTAQLVRAAPEEHLWAGTFEADLGDVITLQREIAQSIAAHIGLKLKSSAATAQHALGPVNPDALDAYLRGNYSINRAGGVPLTTGIEFFRRAIAIDPNYAPAYIGLCLANVQMSFGHGPESPAKALTEMKQSAEHALRLDDTIADAHACTGWVKAMGEWDWIGGENEFRRAIELNPSSVEAHRMYSWYLSAMRRHGEAIEESHLARRLDPVSLSAAYSAGAAYWWARKYRECGEEVQDMQHIDPAFPGGSELAGGLALQAGEYQAAVAKHERAASLSGEKVAVFSLSHAGCAYARWGRNVEAIRILERLQSAAAKQYVSPYVVAYLQTALERKTDALRSLENAYSERNPMMVFLQVDPLFDSLRSDKVFQDLLRRMNFPKA